MSEVLIEVPKEACTPSVLLALKRILHANEGYATTVLRVRLDSGVQPLELGQEFKVGIGPRLEEALTRLGLFYRVDAS